MTIALQYVMHAAEGADAALATALRALADAVRVVEGCEGVDLLRDADNPSRFVFVERWTSREAHKAGGKTLAKELMAPVMASLAGAPERAWLDYLVRT